MNTFNYVQPDEYRFSQDSVFLAQRVFELIANKKEIFFGLDLCSGCGIVGLDFLFRLKQSGHPMPLVFDFLEVQSIYQSYFEENTKRFGSDLPEVNLITENYTKLKSEEYKSRYDVILSNPPYFRVEQGILSPSEFKNRCRFFIDSDFKNLIEAVDFTLKPQGEAYVLFRDLKQHGCSPIDEARKILAGRRNVNEIGKIRGTSLVLIN